MWRVKRNSCTVKIVVDKIVKTFLVNVNVVQLCICLGSSKISGFYIIRRWPIAYIVLHTYVC